MKIDVRTFPACVKALVAKCHALDQAVCRNSRIPAAHFLIAIPSFFAVPGITSAQPGKQEVVVQIRETCHAGREVLEQMQLPELKRRQPAAQMLIKEWKERMPPALQEQLPTPLQFGLMVESSCLSDLIDTADTMKALLMKCEMISENINPGTVAQFLDVAGNLDSAFKVMRGRWHGPPAQERANYKASLNKSIDLLTYYAPVNSNTYVFIRASLDPDAIDSAIMAQRDLLIPVIFGIGHFK